MIPICQQGCSVSFHVRVQTRAKRNATTGEIGDVLKVSMTAPPVEGRANDACIGFFAKLLKAPRTSVTIASGLTSRNKVIRVAGISTELLRLHLGMSLGNTRSLDSSSAHKRLRHRSG
jgi:uncharacterized protein